MKAGLYLRLSREDEGDARSESIQNQEDFLTRYAQEHGFPIAGVYRDDGYSGTRFDRPGFNAMLADIESGAVDAVIVKDMSRLGRDYIQTGYYLEIYFPARNVRFIAVNDGVDTAEELHDMTPVRAVFNDMYAKDISRKVRTALTTKKQLGRFIGASAPYGYCKDPADPGRLAVDARTAGTVRLIYSMYLSGASITGIAEQLTAMRLPTPAEEKGARTGGAWNGATVRRILSSPTYAGSLTQNRTRKVNYKVDQKRALPKSEWIVVPGTHEPIIAQADFEAVQRRLAARSYQSPERRGSCHLLTGLAFCGDCGSPMTVVRESETRHYLVCSGWRRRKEPNRCTSHCVREDYVLAEIGLQLRLLAERFVDANRLAAEAVNCRSTPEAQLHEAAQARLAALAEHKLTLYHDRLRGVVTEADYIAFAAQLHAEEETLRAQADALERRAEEAGHLDLAAFLSFEPLTRAALLELIARVTVYPAHRIAIQFTFDDPHPERQ